MREEVTSPPKLPAKGGTQKKLHFEGQQVDCLGTEVSGEGRLAVRPDGPVGEV
jgi:hypothetical protein